MTFTVQWTVQDGMVSVARETARSALREAERLADLGVRNIKIGAPGCDLVAVANFAMSFERRVKGTLSH